MTNEPVWIGIDLGTQSVRALAVTASGVIAGSGTSKLSSTRDGPRHEQDPAGWWTAVGEACRAALNDVTGPVGGVAVDSTSGTVLLVDDRGGPLTPALMYDDTRAAEHVDRVNEVGEHVWEVLGYRRMQPAWALPKLLWLYEEYPDLAPNARIAHQGDFVNERLVGAPVATDLSQALKTGVDLVAERWPTGILAELGIPERALPDVVRMGTVIGTVCEAAAHVTSLPVGTPVVAGATDGCAAQLGAGALAVGSWNSVIGTTLVLKGVTAELLRDPLGVVYSHRSPDGRWLPGGASSTGAGAISARFPGRDLQELSARAGNFEPASVLAYPLASARGERFPFVAPQAEGFVLGTPSGDEELYAAMLQGISYVERLCFDYLQSLGAAVDGDLLLTGGATQSAYWCQLRADVLGRPVCLPESAEPALGMAALAASPGRTAADVVAEMVRIREVIEPRDGVSERFTEPYVRLVDELAERGWLEAEPARHAREGAR